MSMRSQSLPVHVATGRLRAVAAALLGLLACGSARAAPCEAPVAPLAVDTLVAKVETALTASETDSIPPLAQELRDALPCLNAVLDGRQVGGVHRVLALDAFISRDKERSEAHFAAMRLSDAEYVFGDYLPPVHPIRAAMGAVDLTEVPTVALPPPENGRVWVNGKMAERRPEKLPALVQWERGRGKVGLTALLMPGDPDPGWPVAKAVTKAPEGEQAPKPPRKGPRWMLVGAGGASLVASAGLATWASASADAWGECAGAALSRCLEQNRDAAAAAWKGETAWDELSPLEQKAEVLRYGAGAAYADNRLASGLALGTAALGAGLITVGFVW